MSVPAPPSTYISSVSSAVSYFDALMNYAPSLVTKETISGYTVNGGSLPIYRVGNPNGGVVMFDGCAHGGERRNCDLLYWYLRWLLTSNHSRANEILQKNWTIIIPIANIDGFPTSRLNRGGVNIDGTQYYVDLNRNFGWAWGEPAPADPYGAGNQCTDPLYVGTNCTEATKLHCCYPSIDYYCGPSPNSELESQKYLQIWNRYRPKHYLNLHTGGTMGVLWDTPLFNTNGLRTTLTQPVFNRYRNVIAQEFGVSQYAFLEPDAGKGNYPGEAYYNHGSIGWSCETVNYTLPAYSDIDTVILKDLWLPVLVTLSLESQSAISPPPPPPPPAMAALLIPLLAVGGYYLYKYFLKGKLKL